MDIDTVCNYLIKQLFYASK